MTKRYVKPRHNYATRKGSGYWGYRSAIVPASKRLYLLSRRTRDNIFDRMHSIRRRVDAALKRWVWQKRALPSKRKNHRLYLTMRLNMSVLRHAAAKKEGSRL